jgi:hypothetical protein
MKPMHLILICGCALLARADTVDITLQESTLAGAPGSVLEFFGNLTNTTGSDVFLNADNFNLTGLPLSSIDDSPFFDNTPSGFLGPLASSGLIGLFNITIPAGFAAGSYDGTFQILGGGTVDDQTVVGSADFTAQVTSTTSTTPEPGSMVLVLIGLVLAAVAARLRGGRYWPKAAATRNAASGAPSGDTLSSSR